MDKMVKSYFLLELGIWNQKELLVGSAYTETKLAVDI